MQFHHLHRRGVPPTPHATVDRLPAEGFLWLDLTHDEAADWPARVHALTGLEVHEEHVRDSRNTTHPSYFDRTDRYDMLIFQALVPEGCDAVTGEIGTTSISFFHFDRLLVTLHAADLRAFDRIHLAFREARQRLPSTPIGLIHAILDEIVDRYLPTIDTLESRLTQLQDGLFDPASRFGDWRPLLGCRRQAHQFELLCGHNLQVIDLWRRRMRADATQNQGVRLNDLVEHLTRVERHADALQKDVEVAVQLHFAAMSHRTNEVVRTLTAVSIVFFPLTLITGIYGMNFEHMPELAWRYGYPMVLGTLAMTAVGLILWMRRRRVL